MLLLYRVSQHSIIQPTLCFKKMSYTYSSIDPRGRPQSRPVVITIFTQVVCPSVRPEISNIKRKITAGRDCGMAKWIIDDSSLVISTSAKKALTNILEIHISCKVCFYSQSRRLNNALPKEPHTKSVYM